MEKVFCFIFSFLLLFVSCEKPQPFHEDGSEITAAEAVEIVRPTIKKYAEQGRFWSIGKNPIQPRTTLKYGPLGNYDPTSKNSGSFKSPNYKAWLIIIRPDMNYNGSPNGSMCLFVNTRTGDYEEVEIDGEVYGIEWDESFYIITDNTSISNIGSLSPATSSRISRKSQPMTSGLYAVIISGGIKKEKNFSRYWNDCQYIYKRLTQVLGYDENHIYCLVADGTNPEADMMYAYDYWNDVSLYTSSPLDFDNDGDNDIQYSATKANISAVFNLLQSQSASIDHLLVFITDHGSAEGLCLWGNNQIMTPSELDAELEKVQNARIDVVMGQCNSGVFVTPLYDNNRTISTACSALENSVGNGFSYDYFLRWWTDAFNPSNASTVDTNSDNMISLREAFVYASTEPMAANGTEHPQYASLPLIYGYTHDLLGADNCPVISGSDYLSCNFTSSYTISGLPPSTSVTWDTPGNIMLSSPTNTAVTAKGDLNNSTAYVARNGSILAYFTLEGTTYSVHKNILSIWKPGIYYGPYIFGSSGQYTVESGTGASGYYWYTNNSAWVIMSQGSSGTTIMEGPTSSPVTLSVNFYDPWGNLLIVSRQYNPY